MAAEDTEQGAAVVTAWGELPVEVVTPGVIRQTIQGERQTLVRYRYAPGSRFPVHAHPEEQFTIVLSGRIAFEIGGDRFELGPGEVIVIPGGVPHSAAIIGHEAVETLNTLSPRRATAPLVTAGAGAVPGGDR